PEMLSQARERVAANGWRNVTLIESAIEDAAIPEVADAAVVLTHDVMRSPEALGNVLAHVRPGGRIATAGGKRAPTWALPANLYLRYAMCSTPPPWRASIVPGATWKHSSRIFGSNRCLSE